jgi:hypothetical protein
VHVNDGLVSKGGICEWRKAEVGLGRNDVRLFLVVLAHIAMGCCGEMNVRVRIELPVMFS